MLEPVQLQGAAVGQLAQAVGRARCQAHHLRMKPGGAGAGERSCMSSVTLPCSRDWKGQLRCRGACTAGGAAPLDGACHADQLEKLVNTGGWPQLAGWSSDAGGAHLRAQRFLLLRHLKVLGKQLANLASLWARLGDTQQWDHTSGAKEAW